MFFGVELPNKSYFLSHDYFHKLYEKEGETILYLNDIDLFIRMLRKFLGKMLCIIRRKYLYLLDFYFVSLALDN